MFCMELKEELNDMIKFVFWKIALVAKWRMNWRVKNAYTIT